MMSPAPNRTIWQRAVFGYVPQGPVDFSMLSVRETLKPDLPAYPVTRG